MKHVYEHNVIWYCEHFKTNQFNNSSGIVGFFKKKTKAKKDLFYCLTLLPYSALNYDLNFVIEL